ncbi:2-methylene-furan-3-one reductase [Hondaea fermentalgiana]|uniref:2-methylene-furan-3-one reductase n=1 Tax=Hondaea fermentalgiana TaxID=2315210 RepID=A0A2R5G0R4_9STRA|nr:2-methylene-furan-3-one reductase [Hondaea fermentalgiana]|eukprot:GBG24115.1 2-methylene-furan-3-one reductase [Hondaea fermentalgiana]
MASGSTSSAAADTMQACFYAKFGGPEVDQVGEVPRPKAQDLAEGQVYGFDFCGKVVASKSTEWVAGDEVFGMCKGLRRGGLAEFFIVDGDICVRRPPNMPSFDAAGLPLVGITVLKAFSKCRLLPAAQRSSSQKAPRILVLGGAGGVGTVAIQLAKGYYGASFVATTASAGEKSDLVRELGADRVVNYRDEKFWQVLASSSQDDLFDAILDCTGEAAKCPSLLRDGGGLVSIAASPTVAALREFIEESDTRSFHKITFGVDGFLHSTFGGFIFDRLTGAASLESKCRKRGGGTFAHIIGTGHREYVEILAAEYNAGRLRTVIDHVYPLRDGIQAIERIESGRAKGKVIISIADEEASTTTAI